MLQGTRGLVGHTPPRPPPPPRTLPVPLLCAGPESLSLSVHNSYMRERTQVISKVHSELISGTRSTQKETNLRNQKVGRLVLPASQKVPRGGPGWPRVLSVSELATPRCSPSLRLEPQIGSRDEHALPESLVGWLEKKQLNAFLIVGWQEVNELL